MTQPHDPWIGRKLGKYQVLKRIGQGGMGVVYEAQDTVLERRVAIKLTPEELARDPATLQRFLREARAAAKLNHPHVVTIHEVDERDGVHFLVMELVQGASAQHVLTKKGPFPWRTAVKITADVCRGLVAAHAAGLIHRDIKPANIMLGQDGAVKLADFGLAKAVAQTGATVTHKGQICGTPDFMSPEQCQGEADHRSDLYSLGATFFVMLTGKLPFPGGDPMATMFAHCSRPFPDPRLARPEIPGACQQVIGKATAKSRTQRYQTAREMLEHLDTILMGSGTLDPREFAVAGLTPPEAPYEGATVVVSNPPLRRLPLPRRSLAIAAAVSLAVLALLWIVFRGGPEARDPVADADRALKQVDAVVARLVKANPGFDGKRTYQQENGVVTELGFNIDAITDLSPLADMKGLTSLVMEASFQNASKLNDLSPLRSLKLKKLAVVHAPVKDISPLDGMPLEELDLSTTQVADIWPLKSMKLRKLSLFGTSVTNLGPLAGLPLKELKVGHYGLSDIRPLAGLDLTFLSLHSAEGVTDIRPLAGMKNLTKLNLYGVKVSDLTPLKGLPITWLDLSVTQVSDLTPLEGLPLVHLNLVHLNIQDLSPLRKTPLRELWMDQADFERKVAQANLTSLRMLNGLSYKR